MSRFALLMLWSFGVIFTRRSHLRSPGQLPLSKEAGSR